MDSLSYVSYTNSFSYILTGSSMGIASSVLGYILSLENLKLWHMLLMFLYILILIR